MVHLLVIGAAWRFKPVPDGFQGRLWCPRCNGLTSFTEIQATRYLAVWFIPIWATDRLDPHIRCGACGTRYEKPSFFPSPEALADAEEAEAARTAPTLTPTREEG